MSRGGLVAEALQVELGGKFIVLIQFNILIAKIILNRAN